MSSRVAHAGGDAVHRGLVETEGGRVTVSFGVATTVATPSKWPGRTSPSQRDETPDTGCGIKLFDRAVFLDLPYFDHMHRYLPALVKRAGWDCVSVPVNHRERATGVSKYNNLHRAWVGLADLRGVGWLIKRSKLTGADEVVRVMRVKNGA